jgi:serine/threonine protein kinase
LKPANILLQGDTPRLADFGISRALRTTASSQSSNVSGTFAYMPPEGFDGKRSVQTDVWSVGVNLYQFLSGTLPFPNKEPSALIAAIMMREFEPLPSDVPQNLQNVIAKALAKQPENRYASAAVMREDLRRFLRGEAVADFIQSDSCQSFPVEQVTQIRKSSVLSPNNSQDENETVVRSAPNFGQSEKSKSSNVWKYATLALILVVAVGLGIYFLANQSKQSDSNKNEITQVSATQTITNYSNSENVSPAAISNIDAVIPTPIPTPNKAQLQRSIKSLTVTIAKSENATADYYKDSQKVIYADLDNDGLEDATLLFVLSSKDNPREYWSNLAVFKNNGSEYEFVSSKDVSRARNAKDVTLKSVKKGVIQIETLSLADSDGICCPSIKNRVGFILQGNKLIEK